MLGLSEFEGVILTRQSLGLLLQMLKAGIDGQALARGWVTHNEPFLGCLWSAKSGEKRFGCSELFRRVKPFPRTRMHPVRREKLRDQRMLIKPTDGIVGIALT